MTKRYTGGVISSSLPTVNAAGASGVFLLSQQADYQSRNSWPPFKVEESLRFRSSASAYLNRTPASAGNRRTYTWSGWVKRGTLTVPGQTLFDAYSGVNDRTHLQFDNFQLRFFNNVSGSIITELRSTQVFRDASAWYHFVLAVDTTQATSSNRVKLYVNGSQITALATATYQNQNTDTYINATNVHDIGVGGAYADEYFDGYMSEVYLIDGQALTPSSFGATDKDGNWSPIAYTGTYGTNGFYVNFRDNTSATTMGSDYSGNGNNWTLNNFNVSTANTTYDIMIDVPEDQAGANNRGNYCTLNPLTFWNSIGGGSLTNGNLTLTADSGNNRDTRAWGTMGVSTGKWYYETTVNAVDSTYMSIGVSNYILGANTGFSYGSQWIYHSDGNKVNSANPADTGTSYGNTYTTNDIIGVAVDMDNGKIWFSKNGTYQASGDPVAGTNAAFTNLTSTTVYPFAYHWSAGSQQSPNFGQRPWAYAPPAGYKALCTTNLPEPTIKQPNKYMDTVLYTGDGTTSKTVSGLNFQPDWVWIKARSQTYRHSVFDVLRGFGQHLQPSFTDAENTVGTTVGTSFFLGATSTGFTVGVPTSGTYSGNLGTNENGTTYVGWNWKAGDSTVTNTSGSISSQVRANPTAGFSIATYTGNGTGGATVGHSLGVTPSMVIVKKRSGIADWPVQHISLGPNASLRLNGTDATTNEPWWNSTAPSSTVFTLGNSNTINQNGETFVAYCFAPIAGYSAFGSYTGNGSTNGPFVHTGFRPKFIMIKCSSTGGTSYNWALIDSVRSYANVGNHTLAANLSDSSSSFGTGVDVFGSANMIDLLSNGFKIRDTGVFANSTGANYIYMAFAEAPFKYARSR